MVYKLDTLDQPPNITQQRAFAFSAKPFALLSFLSSLWIIYHLLIRCGIKSRTMYHRLILSAAICLTILSFCLFWGTWAIPVGTISVVGASGNDNTCAAQGFLYDWTSVAFPFYYASFSVLALVSIKHDFKEEKYAWIEKWIHIGAVLPPLIFVVCAAVKDMIKPGFAFCSFRYPIDAVNSDLSHKRWHEILALIQFAELLVATITIAYLMFNFSKMQASIDAAIGMTKIREQARRRRTRDVTIQSSLYLFSFWFMYTANIAAMTIYYLSDHIPYNALIVANVITGTQGMILLTVYCGVRQNDQTKIITSVSESLHGYRNNETETVSMIRANAANQADQPRLSILRPESFRIFDGTPAVDSPWAAFLEDDTDSQGISDGAFETESDLSSGLLSNYK